MVFAVPAVDSFAAVPFACLATALDNTVAGLVGNSTAIAVAAAVTAVHIGIEAALADWNTVAPPECQRWYLCLLPIANQPMDSRSQRLTATKELEKNVCVIYSSVCNALVDFTFTTYRKNNDEANLFHHHCLFHHLKI